VRLLEGPASTLIAGFGNGMVGLWSIEDGTVQETIKLHGPIRHIARRRDRLLVATELGDHATIDLGDYTESYCDLLRRVWAQVPVGIEAGQIQLQAPLRAHRCAR
jgi:hypothetical protein